ncbi:MAG: tRNA (guanosine(46)-N7)-methyltransferase TrmB [Candidatus Gracilibacteria bacterium]|nr:tRNA (guanosine(46)-N7)-methyltransferase TrmB [Candidatus Gracilibacteria bacterium]
MKNNPYIQIIQTDTHILQDTTKIYSNAGNWSSFFDNQNEIYLEIGTGLGNFFSLEASENQDKNFIGMEIKYKRLFKTAEKSRNLGVKNFVVLKDFGQNIDKIFAKNEISRTYVFFPDPWDNKDRQKKHKLLQKDFLIKLYNITKVGGKFCFKTDHLNYFREVLEIIKELNLWKIDFLSYDYEKESEIFNKQKLTEFESMFREDKLKINYCEFVK